LKRHRISGLVASVLSNAWRATSLPEITKPSHRERPFIEDVPIADDHRLIFLADLTAQDSGLAELSLSPKGMLGALKANTIQTP
jgi:hypothetical protein